MQYYSIYDLLVNTNAERGGSYDSLIQFFKKHNVSKKLFESYKECAGLPVDETFKKAIFEFTGMSELELSLAMGVVPEEYKDSYFDKVREIANLLCKQEKDSEKKQLEPFFSTNFGTLYNCDCMDMFRLIEDDSVDLIFADPPFNLDKTYDPGVFDKMLYSEYINWLHQWLNECIRVLKPGGQIFVYNLPKWGVHIASYLGERLSFRNWIAIDMKFSLPISKRLYPAHYSLVSYYKDVNLNTFNNQRIPASTCRHCGGEQADYGGYKSKMNPRGVNLSDVWSDIYPVRHKNDKTRKYNELSVKLLERVISMASNEGDIVLDPFGGSGTTYAVAELLNRRWIGSELGDCSIIEDRLLNIERDQIMLEKVQDDKNRLFTKKTESLRRKNGFWLPEDFEKH